MPRPQTRLQQFLPGWGRKALRTLPSAEPMPRVARIHGRISEPGESEIE